MPGPELFARRSYGGLMSRLVWPTAPLLVLTLAALAAMILWTSEDGLRERLMPLTLLGVCTATVLLALVAGYVRWVARDLARSQEHAQNLLGRDPLSGLPNRLLFAERLDEELNRLGRTGGGLG